MEDEEREPQTRDLRAPLRVSAPPVRRRLRWLTGSIAVVTLLLFGIATWYAYVLGIRAGTDGQVPVVRSDQKPEKVRPDQPGGMNVPNQDKTVYDRLQPEQGSKQVEQMLPPPEEPVARPKEQSAPASPAPAESKQPETKATETKPAETKPAEKKTAEQKATGAPTPITPAAQPKAPQTASAGGYRVQLAALKSSEDAEKTIARLKSSYGDLLGNVPLSVQRADLGEKGIYYRVQSGPMSDGATAKSLCDSLRSRNVGCIVVRP